MRKYLFALGLATCVLPLTAGLGCGNSTPETAAEADNGPLAEAHRHVQAGETCFICDPTKRDPDRLWCREHARYEDRCWVCHPQLEDTTRLFCTEHSLYEDECFLCHPELMEQQDEEAPGDQANVWSPSTHGTSTSEALFCDEHQVPELECGICQPQRAADLEPGEELKVRFESELAAAKAGIRTAAPEFTENRASVGAVCEVRYNENNLARITPLSAGIVRRVFVDVGFEVKEGETLVEIHSAEIAAAKTEFLVAAVNAQLKELAYERVNRLAAKHLSSEVELQEAHAAHQISALALKTAEQRLLNYGFSENEIARIEEVQDASAVLLVRAPFGGSLVDREAVVGEAVEPGDPLFTLADLSTVWLSLSIPADNAQFLHRGLEVEATMSSMPGLRASGILTWVNPSIDENSRMVQLRAVVQNPHRQLKAGMFGNARVLLSRDTPSPGVPVEAIQEFENRSFIFVKHADDLYALRRVLVQPASEGVSAVIAGLHPDESVVVEGAFIAMSEFLKSRLGAGCVDD